jgi:succinoglycan biosynthesis protein ExoL
LDAAVHRRIRMLTLGGATVIPIGFRRCPEAVTQVQGITAVDLGQTSDGKLASRVASVGKAVARIRWLARFLRDADVLLARNLEMLVIAASARKRYAANAALVYECLDIHRILFANFPLSGALHWLESRLWRNVDLLLTSSPAFVREYFIPRSFPAPTRVVENKVLLADQETIKIPGVHRAPGPPWRIGWFGMLRCARSLEILCALAREANGAVEVVIRGRPSEAVFKNLERTITGRPHVHFGGPYRNPKDLLAIYGDVHFTWAIDFYESGQNSALLLPNRIYEGCLYGAVPIALAQVETGRWLADQGVGVLLDDPCEIPLLNLFRHLSAKTYLTLAHAVDELPRWVVADNDQNCRDLIAAFRLVCR